MTKRFIQEDILGEFGFRLLWEVEDYWADVKAYKIAGRDAEGKAYSENGVKSLVVFLKTLNHILQALLNGMAAQS